MYGLVGSMNKIEMSLLKLKRFNIGIKKLSKIKCRSLLSQ